MCFVFHIVSLPVFVTVYVGTASVVNVVNFYDDSMHSWPSILYCTVTADPHGKESESLQVSLSFTYLSWHALKASY